MNAQQSAEVEPSRLTTGESSLAPFPGGTIGRAMLDACEKLPFGFAVLNDHDEIAFANRRFRQQMHVVTGDKLPMTDRADQVGSDAGLDRIWLATADGRQWPARRQVVADNHHLVSLDLGNDQDSPSWSSERERRDALTGLPNRVVLRERLEAALRDPDPTAGYALFLLDVDRFKLVNDTLGHPIGDKLLCRISERLQKLVKPDDIVARLGGDEFAILQREPGKPEAARTLASRLVDLIGRSYIIDEHLINVGLSVGIARLPDDGTDPDRLLTSADQALYSAKENGRARFYFFEEAMDVRAQARRTLELDLRKALALREFEVHYQPQVNLSEGEIAGFEALVRWKHPKQGMISPASFIPIAEETGLIVGIGEWVLRTACHEAMSWPGHVKVAVNLSPVQFSHTGLVATVTSALAASGLAPQRLELEITESVLLQTTESTLAILHQLRDLGVQIAMDDFGTGYSSLSYLRAFPFDKVKIDQSFIRDMHSDNGCAAIVRTVVALGISLGITTTAEGVETEQQLEHLRAEGCTDVQGYLISKPVPADQVTALLRPVTAAQAQTRNDAIKGV